MENDAVLFVIARISSFRMHSSYTGLAAVDAPNFRAYSDPILFDSGPRNYRGASTRSSHSIVNNYPIPSVP
jgi:hypothetical protein